MRVMITGGTGFVGLHSARALMQAGHDVCLLVRSVDKAKKLYGDAVPDLVVGDIVDSESVAEAMSGRGEAWKFAAPQKGARRD